MDSIQLEVKYDCSVTISRIAAELQLKLDAYCRSHPKTLKDFLYIQKTLTDILENREVICPDKKLWKDILDQEYKRLNK